MRRDADKIDVRRYKPPRSITALVSHAVSTKIFGGTPAGAAVQRVMTSR